MHLNKKSKKISKQRINQHLQILKKIKKVPYFFENQNKLKIALDYFQQAWIIYEKFLPIEHSDRVMVEHNIRQATEKNELT